MENILTANSIILWIVTGFNLLLTLSLVRHLSKSQSLSSTQALPEPDIGVSAPDFLVENLDGEKVTLSTYVNRAVTFVFLSSTCPICVQVVPTLKALAPFAKCAGVELVVAFLGTRGEAERFISKYNISLPTLIAPSESSLIQAYKVVATPLYYFIDERGIVRSAGSLDDKWHQLTDHWLASNAVIS